jgi:hypothetical protein
MMQALAGGDITGRSRPMAAASSLIRRLPTSVPCSSTRATSWWFSAQSIPQNTLNSRSSYQAVDPDPSLVQDTRAP